MTRKIHEDCGKSTRDLIDAEKLIEMLPLKAGDTFLDAGCGDGFISLEAASAAGDEEGSSRLIYTQNRLRS